MTEPSTASSETPCTGAASTTRACATRSSAKRSRRLPRYLHDHAGTQSGLEDLLLRICDRHRIPRPQTQHGSNPRVDFIWHTEHLIVEVDGWLAHGTRHAFQRDRTTTNTLQLAGYTVLRFTEDDLTNRPRAVAKQIRRALAPNPAAASRASSSPHPGH